jgi:hypothetical protein
VSWGRGKAGGPSFEMSTGTLLCDKIYLPKISLPLFHSASLFLTVISSLLVPIFFNSFSSSFPFSFHYFLFLSFSFLRFHLLLLIQPLIL